MPDVKQTTISIGLTESLGNYNNIKVAVELSAVPDEDGRIYLEDGTEFVPDENGAMGFYFRPAPQGWR